jgi:hypothetical protein
MQGIAETAGDALLLGLAGFFGHQAFTAHHSPVRLSL